MGRVGRRRDGYGLGISGMWQREAGDLPPRAFAHCVGASEDLILRLKIHKNLKKHRGCVNTVAFNSIGDVLISSSDDRKVNLWNWDSGHVKLSFHSGHMNNVFHAQFMPYTNDRTIVTCGADGEVRYAQILEGGEVATSKLQEHKGRVHKIAIEPGSPYTFYSCGEDGSIYHFDLRAKSSKLLFICHSLHNKSMQSIVSLNAISIDPMNPNCFVVAGSDEYARVFDIRHCNWDGLLADDPQPSQIYCPLHLVGNRQVGISGLAFSDQSELLVSYNCERIYMFSRNQGLNADVASSSGCAVDKDSGSNGVSAGVESMPRFQVYDGHQNRDTVKGVSFFGPSCEYVASGSDCGRIFIWKKKDGKLLRAMKGDTYVVNCIESHPCATVLASSGIDNDIKIWTPNARKRSSLINVDELEPKSKTRFRPCTLPGELISQLLAEDGNSGLSLADIVAHYSRGDLSIPNDCIVS